MAYIGARKPGREEWSADKRGPSARETSPADSVLRLQRAVGNRAVGGLVLQVARKTLDDEVKAAQPRGLKLNPVFTKFQADYKPFDGATLREDINVVFGPGVNSDRAFRSGLQSIGIDNISAIQADKQKLVSLDDETQEVYLDFANDFPDDDDAKQFAAESGIWRFTFVKLAAPAKGSKVTHDLLIEQVSKGARPLSTPASNAVRKQREDRFNALGFTFAAAGLPSVEVSQDPAITADEKQFTAQLRATVESDRKALATAQGAKPQDQGKIQALRAQLDKHQSEVDVRSATTKTFTEQEKDVVLSAVELTTDPLAKRVSGLTFARVGSGAPSDEGADYGSDQHTIRCFDGAFRMGNTWFQKGSENVRTVLHEIGHAIDYSEHRAAHGLSIHASDDASRKAAEDANKKARYLSGGGDANSAFQAAVQQDGGAITAYGEVKRDGGPAEGYAEAFSLYTVDPDLLKKLRPHVFAYFEGLQKKGP